MFPGRWIGSGNKNFAFVTLQNTTLQEHFKCDISVKMIAEILQFLKNIFKKS